jgi:hypothetical protein
MVQARNAGSDTGGLSRLPRKSPSLKKNTNSATGSKTGKHDPGGTEVMQEDAANLAEQGTGRQRVRQLPGAGADNRR